MAATEKPPEASLAAAIVSNYPLEDLFRTGYSMILELKNKALKWQKQSWFTKNHLSLSFWGETLVGHVGGLLLKHPQHFDNYASGRLYREFSSMEDIKTAADALSEVMFFDHLFSLTDIDTTRFPGNRFITAQNLLLTLWARTRLGLTPANSPEPIAVDPFRPFYKEFWDTGTREGYIKTSVKADFLDWLSAFTNTTTHAISEKGSVALENLFCRIEEEFGRVSGEHLDHRFIDLFLLKK